MNYLIIDSETNGKNTGDDAIGKFKSDPFHPDNKAVWWGWRRWDDTITHTAKHSTFGTNSEDIKLIVGQNIKFDLLYMWKGNPACRKAIYDGGITIWCTQLAEYLLSGQEHKWASLDELVGKHGGTIKDSRMKEYWDNGVDTEDIPDSEIVPYLRGDVDNTHHIFLQQVKAAHSLGMLPLIASQMEALLATTEMEYNGMAFDKPMSSLMGVDVMKNATVLENTLNEKMCLAGMNNPNCGSNPQVGTYIFGGSHKYEVRESMLDEDGEPLMFKSGAKKGEPRTKKVEHSNIILPAMKKPWGADKAVNNDVLTELSRDLNPMLKADAALLEFINQLLEYRGLIKDAKTYYIGFGNLVWPDGKIHGHFNHCTTNTGRLSSSAPNLQNVTTQEK